MWRNLEALSATRIATQEARCIRCEQMRREGLLDYEMEGIRGGPPRKYTNSPRKAGTTGVKHWILGKISGTIKKLGQ